MAARATCDSPAGGQAGRQEAGKQEAGRQAGGVRKARSGGVSSYLCAPMEMDAPATEYNTYTVHV